ncbi:MAG: transglutaminase-like domain-containing protein [Thermosynechococcaceae cyanobacterium]
MRFPPARQHLYQLLQAPVLNLAEAALYIAQEEYPELEVTVYLNILDTMAHQAKEQLPDVDYPLRVVQALNRYLFEDLGYRGNPKDYYDPRNSFLNDVLDRRTGIPITLSLVYLEVARRIGFPMVGINFPGHFLIQPDRADIDFYVDPFHGGEILFAQDCQDRLAQIYGQPVEMQARFTEAVTPQQLLIRMLLNLKQIYLHQNQLPQCLAASERILLIDPHSADLRDRGILYYRLGQWLAARQDLTEYLEMNPEPEDAALIHQLLEQIDQKT